MEIYSIVCLCIFGILSCYYFVKCYNYCYSKYAREITSQGEIDFTFKRNNKIAIIDEETKEEPRTMCDNEEIRYVENV